MTELRCPECDGTVLTESGGYVDCAECGYFGRLWEDEKIVAIVGCGKAKRDEPAPAGELYTAPYFRLKAQAARFVADEWGIASAEHGFVDPETVLEPYDTVIDDVDTGFDGWGFDVIDRVVELHDPDRLVLFAGKSYREPIIAAATWVGFGSAQIDSPFDETSGIGEQQALLSDLAEWGEA